MRLQSLSLFGLFLLIFVASSTKRVQRYKPTQCNQTLHHRARDLSVIPVYGLTGSEQEMLIYSEQMKYVEAAISVLNTIAAVVTVFVPHVAPVVMLVGTLGVAFTAHVDEKVQEAMDQQLQRVTEKAVQLLDKVVDQDERIQYHLDMNRLYTKYELPVSRVYDASMEFVADPTPGARQNLIHSCKHSRNALDLVQLLANWLSKKNVIANVIKVLDYDPRKFHDFKQRVTTLTVKMGYNTFACHQAYLCPENVQVLARIAQDQCLIAQTPDQVGVTQECNAKAQLELEKHVHHIREILNSYVEHFKKSLVFVMEGKALLENAIAKFSNQTLSEAMDSMYEELGKECRFVGVRGEIIDYCPDFALISCRVGMCFDHMAEKKAKSHWVRDRARDVFFVFVLMMPGAKVTTVSQSACLYQLLATELSGTEDTFNVKSNSEHQKAHVRPHVVAKIPRIKLTFTSVALKLFVNTEEKKQEELFREAHVFHFGCEARYTPDAVVSWIEDEAKTQKKRLEE